MSVRVRFAPSPTGYLHVGGGRSALYNWLFARANDGVFILRSDDTDTARSTDEYRADIVESLRWLGLDWDEGIDIGGPHGTYRQSARFDRYRDAVAGLLASGAAYHSFETPDQLEAFRADAARQGRPPAYDGRFRLDPAEAEARISRGEAAPVRFSVPRPGKTAFDDAVRGSIEFDHLQVDDFVLLRSDGTPTYHLASTVDDVDYRISHVVRGEDLLPSTPKHILLTRALGAAVPIYGHLSLLLGPDGSKLSKRHGDTAIRAYREAGYLAEAVRNYLAILGWSAGKDEELVPIDEMVQRFDLGAVSRNPAVFDVVKLEWMSGAYMRSLETDSFVARTRVWIERDLGRDLSDREAAAYAVLAPLVQERAKVLAEVPGQVRFLFEDVVWDDASWDKVMTGEGVGSVLVAAADALGTLGEWDAASIEESCRAIVARLELSARKVFQPLRVAVTGSSVSPPLFESMEALGRDPTLDRLKAAAVRLDV